MKTYRIASIGAIIFSPLASAIALYYVSRAWLLSEYETTAVAASIAALVVALGLELVGFLAGHLTADSLRQRGVNIRLYSPLLLLAYTIFGVAAVSKVIPIHYASFIITMLAYILYSVFVEVDEEQAKSRAEWRWKMAEKAKDNEAKRQAKYAQPSKVDKVAPQPSATVDKVAELTPAQLKVYTAIKENPSATNTEIAELLGVSRQAVSKHVQNMNGAVQEIRQ